MPIQTKTIVIKVNDKYFLPNLTYTNANLPTNPSKIVVGTNFFDPLNITDISTLYPVITHIANNPPNIPNSSSVFDGFITELNSLYLLEPTLINLKLKSLFERIEATLVVDLMKKAKNRTSFIGENLLNYYYIDVKIANPASLIIIVDRLKGLSGIDFVYVRGELSNVEKQRTATTPLVDMNEPFTKVAVINDRFARIENVSLPKTSQGEVVETDGKLENNLFNDSMGKFEAIKFDGNINQSKSISQTLPPPPPPPSPTILSINDKIDSLFNYCKLMYKDTTIRNKITVVDFERGWKNVKNYPTYSNILSSSLILGGGYNHSSYNIHGQKTLNILFGKKISPKKPNQIEGLCIGAIGKVASACFGSGSSDRDPEPALVKTLMDPSIVIGDIVLLEEQKNRWGKNFLPVEVESAMFAVIRAGVQAGYIIVEAAGNGSHDLNRITPANITHTSMTDSTKTTENPPIDLSLNNKGTGSIVVGGRDNDLKINNTILNHGNRVDYYCFAEPSLISSSALLPTTPTDYEKYKATSMASAITAALVARFQNEAVNIIGRKLTITEIKILLSTIPYPDTPTSLPTPTSFSHFLSSRGISSLTVLKP
jgi:hypothetical protein